MLVYMIAEHQPELDSGVLVAVTSRDDGSMKAGTDLMAAEAVANRHTVLGKLGLDENATILQKVTYSEDRTYDVIRKVNRQDGGKTVAGDALYTYDAGVSIFLPLADCVGVVMYHPEARVLAVLHSGRHSTFADLTEKVLQVLSVDEGLDAAGLKVWLSPAVARASYRLKWFDLADDMRWKNFYDRDGQDYLLDLPGYIRSQCMSVGVRAENITMPVVDTAVDERYYSHSQGDTNARFAILAMMR